MAPTGPSRIEELRGRLQKDPASIAFAQLAEEYRRTGRYKEAVATAEAGLARHPGYVSARVTLGRSFLELGELDAAFRHLTDVLKQAPENLAAIRGLAELHRRRGELPEALEQFKSAFELAGNDPGIEQMVRELKREAGQRAPAPAGVPAPASGAQPAASNAPDIADQVRLRRVSAYLHRWLEAIMAERRARLYGPARP